MPKKRDGRKKPMKFKDAQGRVLHFESQKACAEYFKVHPLTVWRWVQKGYEGINDIPKSSSYRYSLR
jgi:hypothetical protein